MAWKKAQLPSHTIVQRLARQGWHSCNQSISCYWSSSSGHHALLALPPQSCQANMGCQRYGELPHIEHCMSWSERQPHTPCPICYIELECQCLRAASLQSASVDSYVSTGELAERVSMHARMSMFGAQRKDMAQCGIYCYAYATYDLGMQCSLGTIMMRLSWCLSLLSLLLQQLFDTPLALCRS